MDIAKIIENLALMTPGFLLALCVRYAGQAYVSKLFGDDTAERDGRLSLNPAAHYDIMGTIVFPLVVVALLGSAPFGWGRNIPKDVRRYTDMKKGIFWTAFSGPLSNLLIMVASTFTFAVIQVFLPDTFGFKFQMLQMVKYSVLINVIFAVFHLIPFPPLDGAQMVSAFLNYEQARKFEQLERYTFVFFMILWMTNIFGIIVQPVLLIGHLLINLFVGLLSYIG